MIQNTLAYRGFIGSVEYSEEGRFFFGKVLNADVPIRYTGTSAKDLAEDFRSAVDQYINQQEKKQ